MPIDTPFYGIRKKGIVSVVAGAVFFLFLCSCRGSPFSSEGSEAKILGESGGLFVKNVYFCMPYNELLPLENNKMHLEGNILRV